jgi:hypothetical protein
VRKVSVTKKILYLKEKERKRIRNKERGDRTVEITEKQKSDAERSRKWSSAPP